MVFETLQFAAEKAAKGYAVALITVSETEGSSPASAGQMMAVLHDGTTAGTIGGGISEHYVATLAIKAMDAHESSFTFSFDHSEQGMACGGKMSGYGTIVGAEPQLVIFGGGHISQQLAPMATRAGFSVSVVEDRPEFADAFSEAKYILASPEEYSEKVLFNDNTFVVVCTRGHRWDDIALGFCLNQPNAYLGMIGSKNKVITVMDSLKEQGFTKEQLSKVYAPIGLDIASEVPAEIAVSILSEILLIKNHGTLSHKKFEI